MAVQRFVSEMGLLEAKRDQSKVKREEYTFASVNTIGSYYESIDLIG